eukprot:scaffold56036_cov62-Phaeocystis_antarctica.AAC.3
MYRLYSTAFYVAGVARHADRDRRSPSHWPKTGGHPGGPLDFSPLRQRQRHRKPIANHRGGGSIVT